jgi:hypothetical protein
MDNLDKFVKIYSNEGCFSEDLARRLGYPEDSDATGQEHK